MGPLWGGGVTATTSYLLVTDITVLLDQTRLVTVSARMRGEISNGGMAREGEGQKLKVEVAK